MARPRARRAGYCGDCPLHDPWILHIGQSRMGHRLQGGSYDAVGCHGDIEHVGRSGVFTGTIFAMGQLVTVDEKPSSKKGIVRYVLNRALTGMGHERFTAEKPPVGDRPADELARRLLDSGKVKGVSLNGNVVTVTLAAGDSSGLKEIIIDLYTYYVPGVEIPTDEELMAQVEG